MKSTHFIGFPRFPIVPEPFVQTDPRRGFAARLPLLQTGALDLFVGAGGGSELLRDEFGLEEIASVWVSQVLKVSKSHGDTPKSMV